MRRTKKRRNIIIAWLVLAVSICAMVFYGFKLRDTRRVYQVGEESYQALTDLARPGGLPVFKDPQIGTGPSGNSAGSQAGPQPDKQAKVAIPDMEIDFDVLHSINPDIVAWLYCPDTVIDYPIVRATEYDYYLHHLPDGTVNANGTLFIDYNWKGFSDRLTVVYGHNMKSGRMFGSISNYKKQDYFNAHPYMYLYTEEGERFRIDLKYGCVIAAGQWRDRAFMFDVNLDSLLAFAEYNTTFQSDTQISDSDRIITLTTCSYEFNDARYIVVGVLRPEY